VHVFICISIYLLGKGDNKRDEAIISLAYLCE
jgi:hypothetical protein